MDKEQRAVGMEQRVAIGFEVIARLGGDLDVFCDAFERAFRDLFLYIDRCRRFPWYLRTAARSIRPVQKVPELQLHRGVQGGRRKI